MAIIQTVNKYMFFNVFRSLDRHNQFSTEALHCIFDWLEEISEEQDIELDVIAICCDFSELELDEFIANYSVYIDDDDAEDDDAKAQAISDYLGDNGGYYRLLNNGCVLFQVF